jgi:hypothetical protein
MVYRYTVTRNVLHRLQSQGYDTCHRCEKPFKVGDKVVSKHRRNDSRRYHERCYNEMFCEVPE